MYSTSSTQPQCLFIQSGNGSKKLILSINFTHSHVESVLCPLLNLGVTFSPPLRNSSPNSHTPQNYDSLSGYERKLLSPIKSLRNKESNSSKEGITSMLPVITFPWFLPSLGGVACDPDIPDDEVVPVVTPFGA